MIPLHDDNPTDITPLITWFFIGLCVLVFLWQVSLGQEGGQAAVYSFGVIPAVLLGKTQLPEALAVIPADLTVFTSMFMHGGFLHLAGNMLYLWIFGNNVEDAMGHVRFVIFYFLCGIAAVAGQVVQNTDSTIPMIGASGAISGVLGAYLLLYPHARILVAIPLGFIMHMVRLPAGWVLGFWFLIQIFSSLSADPGSAGVAWYAHIGGFAAGLMLVPVFKQRNVKLFHRARSSGRWHERL
ncbi:MAG TPA: rhomboid family intramembrane serine protease [Gammaproteobacteria bacterium]|nr:rhomboid family intramembrane serine protease [Gammaproteobacteria bacterium]